MQRQTANIISKKKKNDHKNETKMYVKQLSEKRGGIWRKDIKVTSIQ